MRIVLEIDPVQMVGFNEAQRDFILRVMAQSIDPRPIRQRYYGGVR